MREASPVLPAVRRHASIRATIVAVSTIAVMMSLPSAATARLGYFPDPDDVASSLDLSGVRLRLNANTHRYTVRLNTYEATRLKRRGTLVVQLDSAGGPRWDFRLYIWNDSGSSGIFCDRDSRPGAGGDFEVVGWDSQRRFSWCRFEGIRRTKAIRWRAFTAKHSGKPFDEVIDRSPDRGWF